MLRAYPVVNQLRQAASSSKHRASSTCSSIVGQSSTLPIISLPNTGKIHKLFPKENLLRQHSSSGKQSVSVSHFAKLRKRTLTIRLRDNSVTLTMAAVVVKSRGSLRVALTRNCPCRHASAAERITVYKKRDIGPPVEQPSPTWPSPPSLHTPLWRLH
jgi:hypothetical protein